MAHPEKVLTGYPRNQTADTSAMTSFAPSLAKSIDSAAACPRAAPEISATYPLSRSMIFAASSVTAAPIWRRYFEIFDSIRAAFN